MAFVIFKLPFSEQITLWKGKINPFQKIVEDNNEKKFLIGKYNQGNELFELKVQEEFISNDINYQNLHFDYLEENPKNLDQKEFCNLIHKAVSKLNKGKTFKKVVLSRVETTKGNINIIESFQNLCKKYPNAFVHLISSKVTGTWLGASPEEFMRVKANQMTTVALAGTLNRNKRKDWTEKEKTEQKWVEVHIEKVLNDLQMQFKKDGPKELQIGNLQHLITEYQTKTTDSTKTEVIINKLNPTPAVCGIPFEEANKFITENESYSRSFYSGVIGPYFNNNQFDLFVNLRCLQITKDHIIQYAGAGITKESIPEAEWEETKNKIEMTKGLLTFI